MINTYSVCGSEKTRWWRCAVLDNDFPEDHTFHNFATRIGTEQFIPQALEMTSKSKPLEELGMTLEHVNTIDTFRSNEYDTNLIIGQCCFKFFNSSTEILQESKETPTYMMGGAGPNDFNITLEGASLYNTKYIVASTECPRYSFSNWLKLTSLYSPVMKSLHTTGVAAFFTSRFDGAFYRMFGLVPLSNKIKEFECNVAAAIVDSMDFPDEIKNSSIIEDIIGFSQMGGIDWEYEQSGKNGGTESHWMVLYKLWSNLLNVDSHPELMDPLTNIILDQLDIIGSEGASEYDGYAASCMLYSEADYERPTHREHYQSLLNLYMYGIVEDTWLEGLHTILSRGNLNIVHDTGLDPFVDDSIAVKIIYSTMKKLQSL